MFRPAILSLLLLALPAALRAEDIPLQRCDRLPVVQVTVAGMNFLFLVDTAANSMLNLESFAYGDPLKISIASWTGTADIRAQKVTIGALSLGEHQFKNLTLPAIDLSAIGHACGRAIDGILGIDLLSKLGATLDLNDHASRLMLHPRSDEQQLSALDQQLPDCQAAFNRADADAFSACLDSAIVLFTSSADFYGREATMQYLRQNYFQQHPPAQLSIVPHAYHFVDDAMWMEYDIRLTANPQAGVMRGTALWHSSGGKWRIVHMNNSTFSAAAAVSGNRP